MNHSRRFYRNYGPSALKSFNVRWDTTDLYIKAESDLSKQALASLKAIRKELELFIKTEPDFLHSLSPIPEKPGCPEAAMHMYRAATAAGTGPMAAVAGAIAELTGRSLLPCSSTVIIENGGDIWIHSADDTDVGIYTDNVYFRDKLALKIRGESSPCSVCTSSSRLGHSLSFGKADSVTVIAENGALADAVATGACNLVQGEDSLEQALEYALSVKGVRGCMAVIGEKLAVQGDIELTPP